MTAFTKAAKGLSRKLCLDLIEGDGGDADILDQCVDLSASPIA